LDKKTWHSIALAHFNYTAGITFLGDKTACLQGARWAQQLPPAMSEFEKFGEQTLVQRPAQPIELAPLFVWLASPEASYITAEVYGATDGMTPV